MIINTIMLEAIPKFGYLANEQLNFFLKKTFYIISNLDWQNQNLVKISTAIYQNYICRRMKNYHQLQNHSRKLSNRNEKHQLWSILRQTHLLVWNRPAEMNLKINMYYKFEDNSNQREITSWLGDLVWNSWS